MMHKSRGICGGSACIGLDFGILNMALSASAKIARAALRLIYLPMFQKSALIGNSVWLGSSLNRLVELAWSKKNVNKKIVLQYERVFTVGDQPCTSEKFWQTTQTTGKLHFELLEKVVLMFVLIKEQVIHLVAIAYVVSLV